MRKGGRYVARRDQGWVTAPHGSPACPQPSWLRLSHVRLQLHSSLHRGMRPQPQSQPKTFQAAAQWHPQSLGVIQGTGAGGATSCAFRVATGRCPPCGNVHVLMLRGTHQHPQYTLNKAAGGPQCPVCPCLASPRAHSTAQSECSPGTLELSLAADKRVLPHGEGSRGCTWSRWAHVGQLGKQLGHVPGSQASVPPGGLLSVTMGRNKVTSKRCHRPWDRAMESQHCP